MKQKTESASEQADRMIFAVDDDHEVLRSLRFLLESVGLPSRTFASALEFLEFLDQSPEPPKGCLVLDVRMPGMSGLELLEELKRRNVNLPTLICTGHGDVPMAVRAMKRGAVDFITKPFNDQQLIDSVQAALTRAEDLQPVQERGRECRERMSTLTPREDEVLGLVVQGQPNKNIAADLNLSEKTIEVHRSNMMKKMQVQSVAELVRLVVSSELDKQL